MPMPSVEKGAAEADLLHCRKLIRDGSKSFFAASLLLPKEVRRSACVIYAFCRISDDAVDAPGARADAVERLRDRLDRAYTGVPLDHPVDRAFAAVVAESGMPRDLPEALLEGLAWDAEGRRFRTVSDVYAYAARVAGAVGAMMTVLMGVRDPVVLARATDLGVAMQLTNICRDIGEDARNGRVYLPLDWLEDAGIDPARFVAEPRFDARIGDMTRRLLDLADRLYARSVPGVAGLPRSCRPAIHAARLIYREIGEEVRRRGHDSIGSRAVVPHRRKLELVAEAVRASTRRARTVALPALVETQYLVDAVPAAAPNPRAEPQFTIPFFSTFARRIVFVIDLFQKLEERDRATRAGMTFGAAE